jgi:hypothetical protein
LFAEKLCFADTNPETSRKAQKERRKRSTELVFSEMRKHKKIEKAHFPAQLDRGTTTGEAQAHQRTN